MKTVIAILLVVIFLGATTNAQKRKKPASRRRSAASKPTEAETSKPAVIGSIITIISKNGDRLTGELLGLSAYSIRIKADNLASTIALDTIASLSFGDGAPPSARVDKPAGPVRTDFARDAGAT